MRATIYVTDDDQNVCSALSRRLARKGHLVRSFHSGEALLEALAYEIPDLLFLDLKMPEMDGLQTLEKVRQSFPETLVVMLTAYGSVEDAVEAMRLGAYDFVIKSVDFSTVNPALERALNFLDLRRRVEYNALENQRHYSWDHVIAASSAMSTVAEQLKTLAAEDTTKVFLQGEVGTGKEFLARVLHYNGHKHTGPFAVVNCTEQNNLLLEAQIFGYERGAFSGANQAMPGALEYAQAGTLFIDGLEHLPLAVQGSLAEALESGLYCRMGGHDRLTFQTRLVVASTKSIVESGQENVFHPKLCSHFRDNQIRIPPLRERKEDIIPLTLKTLQAYGEEIGREKLHIDPSVPPLLLNFEFPGNIRELEALIKRAALCSKTSILTALDFSIHTIDDTDKMTAHNMARVSFEIGRQSLQEIQGMVIQEVLRYAHQDKEQAAQYLHISPHTLEEHLRVLEVNQGKN
jgi:two-component system response regulator AtoC